MAHLDPATGPIPRDEFVRLMDLPAGQAAKAIRKYDPLFGRNYGEVEITWRLTFERRAKETGRATVKARTKEEAEKLGDKLRGWQIDWEPDYSHDQGDLISVEPAAEE